MGSLVFLGKVGVESVDDNEDVDEEEEESVDEIVVGDAELFGTSSYPDDII